MIEIVEDDILIFGPDGEKGVEPPNWWTPNSFARREADALVEYARSKQRELDPAIAVQLTRLSLDGGFDNHLSWLDGSPRLIDTPENTCPGMEEAGKLINSAIDSDQLIAVFCDYDVDGTSAGAVLSWGLDAYKPKLFFGYADAASGFGLTQGFIKEAGQKGASLLITLDCGSGQKDEVKAAQELGMRVIVVDHHQLSPDNPADIHLNPLLQTPASSANTGAQLAWKLVAASQIDRHGKTDPGLWCEPLYLAGMGCLADMGSVALPENRVFFRAARDCVPIGVAMLAERLDEDASHPGGLIATQACLNLPKRTSKVGADVSGSLLAAKSEDEAIPLIEKLLSVYQQGREVRLSMIEEALSQDDSSDYFSFSILGSDYQDWVGYSGPVASTISSKREKPALVFVPRGEDENGKLIYKFSGRGQGQPIGQLIQDESMRDACSIEGKPSIGGHEAVVSGACLEENIDRVKEAAETWASGCTDFQRPEWTGPDAFPFERLVSPERFAAIAEQATLLAPFGRGKQLVRIEAPGRKEERVTHRQSEISVVAALSKGGDHEAPEGWRAYLLELEDNSTYPVCVPHDIELPESKSEWIVKLGRPAPYFIRTWHPL